MINRRIFLGGTVAAASAITLPDLARAQSPGAISKVKTKDGAELFVRDTGGAGRAVIMTHAWPLNADVWDYQATALSKAGMRVITYDRRGFGRSVQPASPKDLDGFPGYTFDTFADDLAAVIEQAAVRDATLVGYSMGGGEVVRYFSRHRGRNIAKVGIVAGTTWLLLKTEDNPGGINAAAFDGIKQGVLGDRKAYLGGLLKNLFLDAKQPATNPVTDAMVDGTLAWAMQASASATVACVEAFSKTDFRKELISIKVPTLILHGTADMAVPFAMAQSTAAGIAQAKLIAYQGGSHGIVLTERDRVSSDLQAFITG